MSETLSPAEVYVSSNGNDANPGTEARPLATLEGARDALRALKAQAGLPPGGVTVWLQGGIYHRTESFSLSEQDSGTAEAPIVYRACPGEEPRLVGGVEINDFQPVTDPAVLERLREHARPHVQVADLSAAGVTDLGQLHTRGFTQPLRPAHLELFFQGKPMALANFPGQGWLPMMGAPGGSDWETAYPAAEGFYFRSQELARLASVPDLWVHGYWAYDWADSHLRVESLDPETGLVKVKEPEAVFAGYRTGQRFCFLNLLEALDLAGEYYVDRDSGLLYFYPPSPVTPGSAWVSVLEETLLTLQEVSHVTLQGLTLECARGNGIEITGGEQVLVSGCTLRNLGNSAVLVHSGREHGVERCEIYGMGDGGISVSGGDRPTLTPGGSYAENNHLHHLGRWNRCYSSGALRLEGVGLRARHTLLHDLPRQAIIIGGNEHLVEFNEIHQVCLETGDVGAFYIGRDWTARGNVVRYNFFHHLGGFNYQVMGIYLDDCASGIEVYGNVLYRAGSAVHLGGGREVTIANNVFVDCYSSVHVDARGASPHPQWRNMVYNLMAPKLEALHAFEPPYSERYPELLDLEPYHAPGAPQEGIPPANDVVIHNLSVGGRWLSASWLPPEPGAVEFRDNLVDEDPHFIAPERLDFRLREDSPAFALGFKPIPFEKIGIQPPAAD
ncbi:MAG: right-handed parallel beta-helix repeat-containing protein [candidate division WS1 bacterium]|nr:right-handed parallel beta-helix repeat-containing protein [candidate division WS1 bacterium]